MLPAALLAIVLLVAFPGTRLARALREILVEAPARRLARVTRGQVVFYAGLSAAGLVLFWLFETEGLRLFMLMAPDLLVWFTVFDVSLFIDVLIMSVTLAAGARLRASAATLVLRGRQVWLLAIARASRREPRTRAGPRRNGSVADEPDPAGFWRLAAA